jgi:hypothetical protein
MAKYRAIEQPLEIKSSLSDLIALAWKDRGIIADFVIPNDDEHALRVQFDKTHIIRILDEMPLSTESEDAKSEGSYPTISPTSLSNRYSGNRNPKHSRWYATRPVTIAL